MNLLKKLEDVKEMVAEGIKQKPEIGLILGSGLGNFVDLMTDTVEIDYSDIPHFPVSTVEGHKGKLVIGKLEGKQVIAMQGRFHLYEGYSAEEVAFPVYVMHMLGIKALVVTNACGGLNPSYKPGDLMLITDHLNLTGSNPLIGPNIDALGLRFTDMSNTYDLELRELTLGVAKELNLSLQEGIYAGQTGPTYSTPAEYKMLRCLGADVIGMSTVPEVIAGNYLGLKILGISCVTDCASGEEIEPLTHQQVIDVANRTKPKFIHLVKGVIQKIECYEHC